MTTIARDQVIDLIDELPSELLPELVHFIEFLRFRIGQDKRAPKSAVEAPLIAVIRRRLPPEDQQRLSLLRARRDAGQLTQEEHAELLAYVERVEREDAERAEALLDLSRLRNTSLPALMSDIGLAPASIPKHANHHEGTSTPTKR